jgi:hypothetical protein
MNERYGIHSLFEGVRTVMARMDGRNWRASSDKGWGALDIDTLIKVLNWTVFSYGS